MKRERLIRQRIFATLRMLPVLAWLAIQISMTALPVHAGTQLNAPEIAALFETLDVDRIVLCTPEGKQVFEEHDEHASHADCRWCQSFASAILPVAPTTATRATLSNHSTGFRRNSDIVSAPAFQKCHPGRAPPTLI